MEGTDEEEAVKHSVRKKEFNEFGGMNVRKRWRRVGQRHTRELNGPERQAERGMTEEHSK